MILIEMFIVIFGYEIKVKIYLLISTIYSNFSFYNKSYFNIKTLCVDLGTYGIIR